LLSTFLNSKKRSAGGFAVFGDREIIPLVIDRDVAAILCCYGFDAESGGRLVDWAPRRLCRGIGAWLGQLRDNTGSNTEFFGPDRAGIRNGLADDCVFAVAGIAEARFAATEVFCAP